MRRAFAFGALAWFALGAGGVRAEPAPVADVLPQLEALLAGELPADVAVSSLFGVPLDRLAEVEARLAQLESEKAALGARIDVQQAAAAPPATIGSDAPPPAQDVAALEAQRAAVRARITYLEALAKGLRGLPEAARRILPGIGEPRSALRAHADAQDALADALAALAERADDLRLRLESGTLVGFRREARDVAKGLDAGSDGLRSRVARLREVAEQERALAQRLESESRALRRLISTSVLAPDRTSRIDTLFLSHVEEQRRLQRAAQHAGPGEGRASLEALAAQAAALAPRPAKVRTVAAASGVVESLGELIARADGALAASASAQGDWRLAFENEVVTVLAGLISPEARNRAYGLSSSMWLDVRAEASLAAQRAAEGWRRVADRAREPVALLTSREGLAGLGRLAAVAALVGVWWLAWRNVGRIVVAGVRVAVNLSRRRGWWSVGSIVRWSGLAQATLPVLLAYPLLRGVCWLIGEHTMAAALLRAVGMPLFWYALGLQLLLGATRRITVGRPALIEVPAARLPRLRRTYARLGLVVAGAAVIRGIVGIAIGDGVIALLVDGVAFFWVGIWAAWEMVHWRAPLAEAWTGIAAESGAEARAAAWMGRSRLGFVFSPWVLLRLAARWLYRSGVELSKRTDIAELLAARRLRRAARQDDSAPRDAAEIPEAYRREFPLKPILGEDDALLLPRDDTVSEIAECIERWRESRSEGSIALIGEKGSGKTTLAALVSRRIDGPGVVQHTLRGKPNGPEELFRDLSPSLPVNGVSTLADWIDGLNAGPERVVLLDEAHNVFLRTVGGFRAYDALVELVNATSGRIFWILLFNSFTWRFLNESRSRLHYFRRLIHLPSWSPDELRDLIRRRNRQTGFEVEFDETLLGSDRADDRLALVEGADGYFRLLHETSGGNPRIATRLWLASLRPIGEKKLLVSAFREPSSEALDKMSDELLFALAAVSQHENLSTDELRRVLNVGEGLARFAVQYLTEAKLVVAKDGSADRVTLAADTYRQTLRALRKKHLLFE